jgi:hypothetical protein
MKSVRNMSEFRGMLLETIQKLQAGDFDYKTARGTSALASCVLNSVKLELLMMRQLGMDAKETKGKSMEKRLKSAKAEPSQIKLVA